MLRLVYLALDFKPNHMKKNIFLGLAILFAGCATSNIVLTDTENANYKYGKTKFDGYSKTMFEQGKTVNVKSCGSCHKLKDPANYTEAQINKIVPRMAIKAKISKEETDALLKFYISSGKHV